MKRKKPSLEGYVDAIIARDSGMPYSQVLDTFDIRPNQFARAVLREISDYIILSQGDVQKKLVEIANNPQRKKELFRMEEEFLKRQYDAIISEEQSILYAGTLIHPENVKTIVYYALTSDNPKLKSNDRKEIIKALRNIHSNIKNKFRNIGMGGLMNRLNKKSSPIAVLKVFDQVYQEKTGNKSLFDLTQTEHLHMWDITVPQSYWSNQRNVREVIYHTLAEINPNFMSNNRGKVVAAVKELPTNLSDYLDSIGLRGLMKCGLKEGYIAPFLEVFDKIYQEKTGDNSLFDMTQKEHIHRWGDNLSAPMKYWQDQKNVQEAVYHTLTENNPLLSSSDRKIVIDTIRKLPNGLQLYLLSINLSGLMCMGLPRGKSMSPRAVLEVFDITYQQRTCNPSLFDQTQADYLKFDMENRLIRN